MKTLSELKFRQKEIDKEISLLQKDLSKPDKYEAAMRAIKKIGIEKELVDFSLDYLKTSPTEESVCRQLNEVIRTVEIIDSRFEGWLVNEGYKRISECSAEIITAKRSEYNGQQKRASFTKKIKFLEFLSPQQSISI